MTVAYRSFDEQRLERDLARFGNAQTHTRDLRQNTPERAQRRKLHALTDTLRPQRGLTILK